MGDPTKVEWTIRYRKRSVESAAHGSKVDESGHVSGGLKHRLELLPRPHQKERTDVAER